MFLTNQGMVQLITIVVFLMLPVVALLSFSSHGRQIRNEKNSSDAMWNSLNHVMLAIFGHALRGGQLPNGNMQRGFDQGMMNPMGMNTDWESAVNMNPDLYGVQHTPNQQLVLANSRAAVGAKRGTGLIIALLTAILTVLLMLVFSK